MFSFCCPSRLTFHPNKDFQVAVVAKPIIRSIPKRPRWTLSGSQHGQRSSGRGKKYPSPMHLLGVFYHFYLQKWGLPPRLRKVIFCRFGNYCSQKFPSVALVQFSGVNRARCGGRARTATRWFRLKVYTWGQRRLSFMKFADNFGIISDLPWNQLVCLKDPMPNSQACDVVMPSSCTILP